MKITLDKSAIIGGFIGAILGIILMNYLPPLNYFTGRNYYNRFLND